MASLQFDPISERWRPRFYYGGREFKRSLAGVQTEQEANAVRGRVEETIMLLERGRLEMPLTADPGQFILSDGKLDQKPVLPRALTLGDLFRLYEERLTEGAKEQNTIRIGKVHAPPSPSTAWLRHHAHRNSGKNSSGALRGPACQGDMEESQNQTAND
jgi:hypothetical protein